MKATIEVVNLADKSDTNSYVVDKKYWPQILIFKILSSTLIRRRLSLVNAHNCLMQG